MPPRRAGRLNRLRKGSRIRAYALVIWRNDRHRLLEMCGRRGTTIYRQLKTLSERNRRIKELKAELEEARWQIRVLNRQLIEERMTRRGR